jgi:hypothetical protein
VRDGSPLAFRYAGRVGSRERGTAWWLAGAIAWAIAACQTATSPEDVAAARCLEAPEAIPSTARDPRPTPSDRRSEDEATTSSARSDAVEPSDEDLAPGAAVEPIASDPDPLADVLRLRATWRSEMRASLHVRRHGSGYTGGVSDDHESSVTLRRWRRGHAAALDASGTEERIVSGGITSGTAVTWRRRWTGTWAVLDGELRVELALRESECERTERLGETHERGACDPAPATLSLRCERERERWVCEEERVPRYDGRTWRPWIFRDGACTLRQRDPDDEEPCPRSR